ncbi:AraC family transcriptional regulator [Cognatiyoonia sp. IB215182]|uniref:AraC family transcriptional regulator n=1 Tax=Cognatiyoonia sp. IB215182 TaxID=3097353 RepID=UPI002A0B89ED|nr:AraC family transcriptional regulator [Cognatiyoonia sp. IB215182]MDX8354768.1 AraC family transcriptional regulator [Cognatiyoonia sp. IB215182]
MYARTQGFVPLDELRFLSLDNMVIDYWKVRSQRGAHGTYASLHPRLTLLFGDVSLAFSAPSWVDETSCAACYVPAGLHLNGAMKIAANFQHLDIHIHRDYLAKRVDKSVDLQKPAFLSKTAQITHLGLLLAQECEQRTRNDTHLRALVDALMLEVFHLRDAAFAGPIDQGWLERTKSYINANLGQHITVDDLANCARLSRTQFNQRFRAETGCSPYQWVKRRRIREAQRMMVTGHALVEIADVMGFSDQAHFNRTFKSVTGTVPSRWIIGQMPAAIGPNVQDNKD